MTLDKCQIITHVTKQLSYTPFDVKWLPCSAKFLVLGQLPRGSGIVQVYELNANSVDLIKETEKPVAFKACTMGASNVSSRHLATGDFNGRLCIWDLERLEQPLYSTQAHEQIINCMDGAGGLGLHTGPPEVVTGSRDGCVKVWDVRVRDKPVVTISPAEGETRRDTWAVAFGIQKLKISFFYSRNILSRMSLIWKI
jgi:WD40 repeat protein